MSGHPTMGVEEEFLLADPATGEPVALNRAVADLAGRRGVDLQLELTSCQVETTSSVAESSAELTRRAPSTAARHCGVGRRCGCAAIGRRAAADASARFPDHRHPALPQDRRAVRHDRARAGHLGLPRSRRRPEPRRGHPGEQPVAAVAAAPACLDGQLGGVPQRRHGTRELAQRAVGTLAECWSAAAFRVRRRLRRDGPR